MEAAVERAHIQPAAAGAVVVPLAPVPGRVGLDVVIQPPLAGSNLEHVKGLVELDALPSGAVVVLVICEPEPVPLSHFEYAVPGVFVRRIYEFLKVSEARVGEERVGLRKTPHGLSVFDFLGKSGVVEARPHERHGEIEVEFVPRRVVVINIDGERDPVAHGRKLGVFLRIRLSPFGAGTAARNHEAHGPFAKAVPVVVKE